MFRNLRIGTRLAAGFGTVLLLTALAIGTGLLQVSAVAAENQRLLSEPLTKERIASDWYRVIESGSKRTLAMAVSPDPILEATFRPDMKESTALSTKYQDQLTRLATSAEERKRLDDIAAARKTYLSLRNEIAGLRRDGRSDEAAAFAERLKPATAGYLGTLQSMLDLERAAIDRQASVIRSEVARSLWILTAIGASVLLAGVGFCIYITRGITLPIRNAVLVARRVAAGDIGHDVVIDRQDEFGALQSSMSDMSRQLRSMIAAIRESASVIAHASTEIASGNADLSNRTEDQAASLQRTAGNVEQLSAAVRNNADSSVRALDLVQSASGSAREGDTIVGEVIGTMRRISSSSNRISEIVGVIDAIAFQTNILALNAAVEAARAGEQGRGFAVVAAEVRTLAQRSATAAKEVRSLIAESTANVDSGEKLVERAGTSMHTIMESVRRVDEIIGHIAVASRDQAEGVAEVNQAVSALDETTQRNAALVEQSAAAAMALQEQACRLEGAIAAFATQAD
jgi:methyl-accepting chemotaxis protein